MVLPLERLNVVTGPNGSGKSNLYRALRLLSDTARGGVIATLAREGGFESTLWAGPETISRGMKSGELRVQGGPRREPVSLRLGFCTESVGYSIDIGLPPPSDSLFTSHPEIKRECIFAAPVFRPGSVLVDRRNAFARLKAVTISGPKGLASFSVSHQPKSFDWRARKARPHPLRKVPEDSYARACESLNQIIDIGR